MRIKFKVTDLAASWLFAAASGRLCLLAAALAVMCRFYGIIGYISQEIARPRLHLMSH